MNKLASLAINGGTPVRESTLPYGRQQIDEDDIAAVVDVLKGDWLTTGPVVGEFEEIFSGQVGAEHAVAVNSGTAALHSAMFALGIGPGDEVIVPAITFVATANCVLYRGATPIFAEVDPETLLIDPKYVDDSITEKTKAIIAVDYAGQPCDYNQLKSVISNHNSSIKIVSDACHSLGGSYNGHPVGVLADLNVFSFHPVKHITTGEGGMVTTWNGRYKDRMDRFRNHGIATDHSQRTSWVYEHIDLGYNYRLTDFQCALGITQLASLDYRIHYRQKIASLYNRALARIPEVKPLHVHDNVRHAYHLYVIKLAERLSRYEIFRALQAEGIGVNVHYMPVHTHLYYMEHIGTGFGMLPVAEAAYERILSLPIFPGMTNEDVNDVVLALKKVIGAYSQ
jgi:perosamine synthetase